MGNTIRRSEPLNVEKFLDEVWIGVKGQSNSVIARSLRNSFRASLIAYVWEVDHWMD